MAERFIAAAHQARPCKPPRKAMPSPIVTTARPAPPNKWRTVSPLRHAQATLCHHPLQHVQFTQGTVLRLLRQFPNIHCHPVTPPAANHDTFFPTSERAFRASTRRTGPRTSAAGIICPPSRMPRQPHTPGKSSGGNGERRCGSPVEGWFRDRLRKLCEMGVDNISYGRMIHTVV